MNIRKKDITNFKYLYIYVLFFSSIVYSQIEITRNITIDDGLAYSQVTSAYKDNNDIMWFGTTAGLSEWNSVEFENYYKVDGLPSTYITSICEDKNSNLFVATKNGLVVKRKSRFVLPINLPEKLKSIINHLFLDSKGILFILTEKQGVWIKDKNVFSQIEVDSSNKHIIPISIVERVNGEILIGTRANGIYIIKENKLKRIINNKTYSKYPVVDLIELNIDTLYIALQGGGLIVKTRNKNYSHITTKHGLTSNYINNLSIDKHGKLYVSTPNGVSIIKNNKVEKKIKIQNGLDNEFVTKSFILDDKTIFFLTEGSGVFVYHPDVYITYNTRSGLLHNNIWKVKELHNGSLCFLTDEGISFLHNGKFSSITTKEGLGDNLVISLYESENNELYVGTYVDGVNVISNGKIKRINEKYGMPQNSVWSILKHSDGNMLFVTHLNGIAVYNGKRITDTLGVKNGLPNTNITSSLKLNDGTILIGVENRGVYKLKHNRFIPYRKELNSNIVWSMHEDEKGNLLFGTNEVGLIRIAQNSKCDTISRKNGLSNNSIIGIDHDDLGNIYALSDKGLNIIHFSENGSYQIKQIYKKDGLANSECNQEAISKDRNGNIWVGTIGGATRINPYKINNSKFLIPVHILKLMVMDKNIGLLDFSKSIVLDYDKNDVTFKFAGINYSNSGIINYKYKLSNIDKNWIYDNSNEIRYANLPPGIYHFFVSASNSWGMWSEPPEIIFEIKKPFWETWWFISLMILLIISSIFFIINYRLKNILRLERLRSKISADLHDEIGSGLSEISILSELLKFNLKNKEESEKSLEHIGNSTRLLIEKLSDIIWIVNPKKESLKSLILRIQDSYQEVLYHSDISLNIINLDLLENITLPLEVKQNLYLLSKEAINNSLKYSECSNIDFEVKKKDNKFCIEITDDGKGFDEERVQKGNGLFNMRKRANNINANLTIESNANRGTKIRVEILLKKFFRRKYD